MPKSNCSRIAEFLFSSDPIRDFARTIAELDTSLTRICGRAPLLIWDCDDVASFDMPGVRILLCLAEGQRPGFGSRLLISVGPSPVPRADGTTIASYASLCEKLVDRLKDRFQPEGVLWHDMEGIATAESIDAIIEKGPCQSRFKQTAPGEKAAPFAQWATDQEQVAAKMLALRDAFAPTPAGTELTRALFQVAGSTIELVTALAMLPSAVYHQASGRGRL